jgi:DNA repair protein RecO (recombination protein O)
MPRSEHTLHAEAVVLRHSDWGEADRVLILFTRDQGKLRAIAKGARRLRSRKAGHLEPFTRVKLLLARGRDFWIVTQAETIDAYLPLREDLLRVAYGSYIIELLDRFTYEVGVSTDAVSRDAKSRTSESHPLFKLLVESLERLADQADGFKTARYFEIRLLDLIGFRPELFHCVECGKPIQPEDQYFGLIQGGVLCPRCGLRAEGARVVTQAALKLLRHYQRSSFIEASRAPLQPSAAAEMENLLHVYLTHLLERNLNSPAFLHEIQKDARSHVG